jgi:hypothetical protein
MGIQLHRASHFILFILVLPLLSLAAAWVCSRGVAMVVPPGWAFAVDSLGTIGAYGLLFKAFDLWLWRWPAFRSLGIVRPPLMAGRWVGSLRSSHDNHEIRHEAVVEVRQSFTSVRVAMYFAGSRSASLIAGFAQEADGGVALHYEYQNVPSVDASRTMHIHYGTATLQCVPGRPRMEGHYYNWGRDERGHYGVMEFSFESARLLGRFSQ